MTDRNDIAGRVIQLADRLDRMHHLRRDAEAYVLEKLEIAHELREVAIDVKHRHQQEGKRQ